MKKIIRFRVYPESVHGFYFEVEIHPTLARMRKAANRRKPGHNFNDAEAVATGYTKGFVKEDGRIAWSKTLGCIFFHRAGCFSEIVAHECTHAALRWAEAMKFNVIDRDDANYIAGNACDNEERFAYALGRMVSQITAKTYEYKIF
jgi:hypothetical protein